MKHFLFIVFLISLILSCNTNTSPEREENTLTKFSQVPGCNKTNLAQILSDSCFTYTFNNTLNINLCLPANCCPDSNRFDYLYSISNDTINLMALDTAARLCRCMCNYIIQIEVDNLHKDQYKFICVYYDSTFYSETILK